jgi:hypothetical protein
MSQGIAFNRDAIPERLAVPRERSAAASRPNDGMSA